MMSILLLVILNIFSDNIQVPEKSRDGVIFKFSTIANFN